MQPAEKAQSNAFLLVRMRSIMTANFDISFSAYVRVSFTRNYKLCDNLLKEMDNNTSNAIVYMSCAENRHV